MGIFSNIRKKERMEQSVSQYFDVINAYSPVFTTFEGSLYEMELTRAAVHSFATHVSKLKPEVNGSGNKGIERILQYRPNPLMDTKKYLYRLATMYMVDNNAFIAPLYDDKFNIIGFYPLATEKCRIVDQNGKKYMRYEMAAGNYGAVELENVGIMNQFQRNDELFGESNACLHPTLELMNTQNEGIVEGVKNSASLRFLARFANILHPDDIERERKRFVSTNLSAANNGGVLMFDTKYAEVKQIDSKPYVIDAEQVKQIKENVFNYFGTNEHILQNNFSSDEWSAYYEGKIEPFALEASLVHTNMVFNNREVAFGNEIVFTANRLQYMTNTEKLTMTTQLFDRGLATHNECREILNMGAVEGGDKMYIRKEYTTIDKLDEGEGEGNAKAE